MRTIVAWIIWAQRLFDRLLIKASEGAIAREAARRRSRLIPRQCEISACQTTAIHFVKWGRSIDQQGNFCECHLREIWNRVQPQVAAGLCFWVQSLPM